MDINICTMSNKNLYNFFKTIKSSYVKGGPTILEKKKEILKKRNKTKQSHKCNIKNENKFKKRRKLKMKTFS